MTSLLDDTTPILVQELSKSFLSLSEDKQGRYFEVVLSDGEYEVLIDRDMTRDHPEHTYNKLKEMLA